MKSCKLLENSQNSSLKRQTPTLPVAVPSILLILSLTEPKKTRSKAIKRRNLLRSRAEARVDVKIVIRLFFNTPRTNYNSPESRLVSSQSDFLSL
jgi:hypothetical protein